MHKSPALILLVLTPTVAAGFGYEITEHAHASSGTCPDLDASAPGCALDDPMTFPGISFDDSFSVVFGEIRTQILIGTGTGTMQDEYTIDVSLDYCGSPPDQIAPGMYQCLMPLRVPLVCHGDNPFVEKPAPSPLVVRQTPMYYESTICNVTGTFYPVSWDQNGAVWILNATLNVTTDENAVQELYYSVDVSHGVNTVHENIITETLIQFWPIIAFVGLLIWAEVTVAPWMYFVALIQGGYMTMAPPAGLEDQRFVLLGLTLTVFMRLYFKIKYEDDNDQKGDTE